MSNPRLDIISEQKSPLFRIMWVTNYDDPSKRQFDNNISAFHIGNGLVLSVAHNLRTENPFLKSVSNTFFEKEVFPKLNQSQKDLFERSYIPDSKSSRRHLAVNQAPVVQSIADTWRASGIDTRWITLMNKKMSVPYLVVQFSNHMYYNNPELTALFNEHAHFYEPHTQQAYIFTQTRSRSRRLWQRYRNI
jgi:hypothetical protein